MNLIPLPAFSDNYLWLLQHEGHALVVDPGDATPVHQWLQDQQLHLDCILVTHHHPDHTGGVSSLQAAYGAQVHGPALETLPFEFQAMNESDELTWRGLTFKVIAVPGHTAGHIAYWAQVPDQAPILFCGDTLFSGGCGRLFEGSPAQMLNSLDRLAQLPSDTRVCCAHEYTLSNLKFALAVEPANQALQAYNQHCSALRQAGRPTLPSTISTEAAINPFLRSREKAVEQAVKHFAGSACGQSEVEVFAHLRQWKNEFK